MDIFTPEKIVTQQRFLFESLKWAWDETVAIPLRNHLRCIFFYSENKPDHWTSKQRLIT